MKNLALIILSTLLFFLGIYSIISLIPKNNITIAQTIDVTVQENGSLKLANDIISYETTFSKLLEILNKYDKSKKINIGYLYQNLGIYVGGYNNEISFIILYYHKTKSFPSAKEFSGNVTLKNSIIDKNLTYNLFKSTFNSSESWENLYLVKQSNLDIYFNFEEKNLISLKFVFMGPTI